MMSLYLVVFHALGRWDVLDLVADENDGIFLSTNTDEGNAGLFMVICSSYCVEVDYWAILESNAFGTRCVMDFLPHIETVTD